MSERQPIEMRPKPDKKGKVVWSAKKEVKTPISREAHRQELLNQRDYFQEQIDKIDTLISQIDRDLAAGKIVHCYKEGGQLGHETQEKPPLGFPHPKPTQSGSTKDSSTWKREQEERGKRN
jgi:hypothetical protein